MPPPCPSPVNGGGERTECAASLSCNHERTRSAALCELLHAGVGGCRLCWERHRAIGDGGGSVAYRRPSWAFPPSTWPRWLLAGGAFFIASGSRSRATALCKKKRAGRSRRDLACGDYAPSVPQARGVGNLFPMGQAFRDDLGRLQGRLAQGRVLDDLALHARGLALQRIAQRLQLGDELVDFLHRRPCYPLQELVDVVGHQVAVALRLAPNAHYVAADEFADFPFHFRFRRGLDFGGLTRLEKGHNRYPRSAPLRAELHLANSRMRM